MPNTHTETSIRPPFLVTFFFAVKKSAVFWRYKPYPLLWVCNYWFIVSPYFESRPFARTQPSPDHSPVSNSPKIYHKGAISKLLSFCTSLLMTLLSTIFQLNSCSFVFVTSWPQPSLMLFLTLRRGKIFPEQRNSQTKGKLQAVFGRMVVLL